MVVLDVVADIVTVSTASTPFWMRFAFNLPELSPVKKHMYEPALPAHESVLPEAVAAAPALAEIETIADGE